LYCTTGLLARDVLLEKLRDKITEKAALKEVRGPCWS
jgi:hypothetical protein